MNLDYLLFDAEYIFPFICLFISAYIFYKNRLPSNCNRKIMTLAGIGVLLPIPFLMIYWTVAIDFGVVAFILIFYLSIPALILGVLFLFMPFRYLKIYGVSLGFIFPVLLFLLVIFASDFSPGAMINKHGNEIAEALDQYKQDRGYYPHLLKELVPKYIVKFKHPNATGWLYSSAEQDFSLGYASHVDRFWYSICFITAKNRKWDCLDDSSAPPFKIEATPFYNATPDW